jgi:hypothetical protein
MNTRNDPKQEYENASHIAKKKKAVESTFHKKNMKEIVELIDEEDSDLAEKYARYIK